MKKTISSLFISGFIFITSSLLSLYAEPMFLIKEGNKGILKQHINRPVRYQPDGNSFVIHNGNLKFNRSLYGSNTAFRVVGGDIPEFMLFGPGKSGTLRIGLINNNESKWIEDVDSIKTIYTPGKLTYKIQDAILGNNPLKLTLLARYDKDGIIIKIDSEDANVNIYFLFGAASGKRFFRNGDLGTDTIPSFTLNAPECIDNKYTIHKNTFLLDYTYRDNPKQLSGCFPSNTTIKETYANIQDSPLQNEQSIRSAEPALAAKFHLSRNQTTYFTISMDGIIPENESSATLFSSSENARKHVAKQIQFSTPDPFFNPLGGALAIAADAVWEDPTWLHGAIGWRVRLNGWRCGYIGNTVGWHNRSRLHFNAYNASQVTKDNEELILPGEKENLAREAKNPNSVLYSKGYIASRPNGQFRMNHYDMNLVYIDALLWHLLYTGDTDYAREVWPVLNHHLDWEKRCFDPDDDGLFDAYCCIWASDALQYTGGDVVHSSSYNFRAFQTAARLANMMELDAKPYQQEANKIHSAINDQLWLPGLGRYAEFKDRMGNKRTHDFPAIWTIYHAIDNQIPDTFQAWQLLRYVDTEIPHIPVEGPGIPEGLSLVSTSKWHPYSWSINNVTIDETAHMALAYWQAGRSEEAYRLWKSITMDFMYVGSCPGNYGQVSYLDAARGETYSDFSDAVGISSRALFEGLYGILPDALEGELLIRPGFPKEWDFAEIKSNNIDYKYNRTDNTETFTIRPKFPKPLKLKLRLKAMKDRIRKVTVNGELVGVKTFESVGTPEVLIQSQDIDTLYKVSIHWSGQKTHSIFDETILPLNQDISHTFNKLNILKIFDPQSIFKDIQISENTVSGKVSGELGHRTLFLKTKQGDFEWWQPWYVEIRPALHIISVNSQTTESIQLYIRNNTQDTLSGNAKIQAGRGEIKQRIYLTGFGESKLVKIPDSLCNPGTNTIQLTLKEMYAKATILNWEISPKWTEYHKVDIKENLNDQVTQIYKNEYLNPRPDQITLQLPKHGYGNWCHYKDYPVIDDSGIRELARDNDEIKLPNQIPFTSYPDGNNVMLTSLWDNYPDSLSVPLNGQASHIYLLMAGSTNHMQSRIENGQIHVIYSDGSREPLSLMNPDNWVSIEQDYHIDDFAFKVDTPLPLRLHLKTGDFYQIGKGIGTEKWIDGGAATVLDLPLDPNKTLSSLTIKTTANDVVIGLMAATLCRN